MTAVSVGITGMAELDRELAQFEKRATQRAVLRRAIVKAAKPMLDAAKANAPDDEGTLQRSIILAAQAVGADAGKAAFAREMRASGDRSAAQAALVSARRAAKASGEVAQVAAYLGPSTDAPHGHLVEFGTGPRMQKTTGRLLGSVAPDPFLRPAWDAQSGPTLSRLSETLRAEIDRAAARIAARAARASAG